MDANVTSMRKDRMVQWLSANMKGENREMVSNSLSDTQRLFLFVDIAASDENEDVRKLAALQAAKLTKEHWPKMHPTKKDEARNKVLACAEVASGQLNRRLLDLAAHTVVSDLTHDKDATQITPYRQKLLELFRSNIQSTRDDDVRFQTIKVLGVHPEIIEHANGETIRDIFKSILDSLDGSDDHEMKVDVDPANYRITCDTLGRFLAYKPGLPTEHLKALLEHMIQSANKVGVEEFIRVKLIDLVTQAVYAHSKKIKCMKDISEILLGASLSIVTEIEEDSVDNKKQPVISALVLINQLSCELSPYQFTAKLLEKFEEWVIGSSREKMAAILALGNAAEGSRHFISTKLSSILPNLVSLLRDKNYGVKHALLVGITLIAEEMAEELAPQHEEIFEGLSETLGQDVARCSECTAVTVCDALKSLNFCSMDKEVAKNHGETFIPRLCALMSRPVPRVKAAAAGALGSIALSMGDGFDHHYHQCGGEFIKYIEAPEPALRSSVWRAICSMVVAVSPDVLRDDIDAFVRCTFVTLDRGHKEVSIFYLWRELHKLYGQSFKAHLPTVREHLTNALKWDNTVKEDNALDAFVDAAKIVNAQAIAIEVLSDIITETDDYPRLSSLLVPYLTSPASHTGLKKAAISALWKMLGYVDESPLENLTEDIVKVTLRTWSCDNNRAVIVSINQSVAETLKSCGYILHIDRFLSVTVNLLASIINCKHPCQWGLVNVDGHDTSELDWLVIETAMDVIFAIAVKLGKNFASHWERFQEPMVEFGGLQEDIKRSKATRTTLEVLRCLGGGVPITDPLAGILMRVLQDNDRDAKIHASSAITQLICDSDESKARCWRDRVVDALNPELEVEGNPYVAGCFSRLIMWSNDSDFIKNVFPLVLDKLPLKNDYEENAHIFNCICDLYTKHNPAVQGLENKLQKLFESVLGDPPNQLDEDTREMVTRCSEGLKGQPSIL